MNKYRITTGTVTYAIKGRDLLRRHGYRVRMERITSGLGSAGCGYSLVVEGPLADVEDLLRRSDIKILEINRLS